MAIIDDMQKTIKGMQSIIDENTALTKRMIEASHYKEKFEQLTKEFAEHQALMQRNQLALVMKSPDAPKIAEDLKKEIIVTLSEWSDDLYNFEDREIDNCSTTSRETYKRLRDERDEKKLNRSRFIETITELLNGETNETNPS